MARTTPRDTTPRRSLRPLLALWPYVRDHRKVLVAALSMLLLGASAQLPMPLVLQRLVDEGVGGGDPSVIDRYFKVFLLVGLLFAIASTFRIHLVEWLSERVVSKLRQDLYVKLVRMDLRFFGAVRSGETLLRLMSDTTLVQFIAGPTLALLLIVAVIGASIAISYPSRRLATALSGFNLNIAAGEMVALVRPSGAGKSTALQLLLRFYDPSEGQVCIDGVNIMHVDPKELRSRIGLVSQRPMLFATSVRENIRYGRPDATDEEVEAAARAAAAHAFIAQMPQRYDTDLGEAGARISGGERQRLAIARAILRDPAILLLDEATSALDTENERLIQQALYRLMKSRTTIIVAHRLATVQRVSRIVVMDSGGVVAIGAHRELLQNCPLYARLAATQLEDDAAVLDLRAV